MPGNLPGACQDTCRSGRAGRWRQRRGGGRCDRLRLRVAGTDHGRGRSTPGPARQEVPGRSCRAAPAGPGGRDHAGRRNPGRPAVAGAGPGLALLRAGVFCHARRPVRPRYRSRARLRRGGCPRGCGAHPGAELRRRPFQRPARRRRPGRGGPQRRRSARWRDRRRSGRCSAGRGARQHRGRGVGRRRQNAGGRPDVARWPRDVRRLRPRFRGCGPSGCRSARCGGAWCCVPGGCVSTGRIPGGGIPKGRPPPAASSEVSSSEVASSGAASSGAASSGGAPFRRCLLGLRPWGWRPRTRYCRAFPLRPRLPPASPPASPARAVRPGLPLRLLPGPPPALPAGHPPVHPPARLLARPVICPLAHPLAHPLRLPQAVHLPGHRRRLPPEPQPRPGKGRRARRRLRSPIWRLPPRPVRRRVRSHLPPCRPGAAPARPIPPPGSARPLRRTRGRSLVPEACPFSRSPSRRWRCPRRFRRRRTRAAPSPRQRQPAAVRLRP